MARHKKSYRGEKWTAPITVKFKPSDRCKLKKSARKSGARSLSEYTRQLCLRRNAAAQVVAGTRRNPEARELICALTAIGNNLNQLAKVANSNRSAPQLKELRATTAEIKRACRRILAL
jgi:hypothetical protein